MTDLTWKDLADAMAECGVEVESAEHFTRLTCDLPEHEKQRAYADYRANWSAKVRGWSLDGFWRKRRAGVKAKHRSYADAATATEEVAT